MFRPLIDRIKEGYQPIPEGYELVNDELIKLNQPAADVPKSLKEELLQEARTATVMTEIKFNAIKPLVTELVIDKPANIVISSSEFILDWEQDKYLPGAVRMWEGQPKKCILEHDSRVNIDWTPATPSLWIPFHATKEHLALPYIAPT